MRLAGTPGESACKPALEAAGEVFQRERAGFAQRPHRPEAKPSTALALASLAQTFLASSGTAT